MCATRLAQCFLFADALMVQAPWALWDLNTGEGVEVCILSDAGECRSHSPRVAYSHMGALTKQEIERCQSSLAFHVASLFCLFCWALLAQGQRSRTRQGRGLHRFVKLFVPRHFDAKAP